VPDELGVSRTADLRELFDSIDADRSGTISIDEFFTWCAPSQPTRARPGAARAGIAAVRLSARPAARPPARPPARAPARVATFATARTRHPAVHAGRSA
jgi:hypothetical protein